MFGIQNRALLSSEEFCSETKNLEQLQNGAGLRLWLVQMNVVPWKDSREGVAHFKH